MPQKRALCVGINHYSPDNNISSLRGCINDTLLIGQMLTIAGFEVRQVHDNAATQEGILQRLESEVAKLRAGDMFVFWNSSHGYQVRDRSGDELWDQLDEATCTYDTDPRDPLIDDKFSQIISRAHPDAMFFFGSDSCHSGTITRVVRQKMTTSYRKPKLWIPPDDVRFRIDQSILNLGSYVEGFNSSGIPSIPLKRIGKLSCDDSTKNMRHLLLSASRPEEVSWDAHFPQGYHGAMTYHFAIPVLTAWKAGKAITYREAYHALCTGLQENQFDQTPQLEGPDQLQDSPVFGYSPSGEALQEPARMFSYR